MLKKLGGLVIAIVITVAANAQYDTKAKVILQKVSTKYSSMKSYKVDFVNKLHSPLADINEETKGSIVIAGDKFRLDLGEQIVMVDGKTMWTYLKEDNEVNISDYDAEDSEMNPAGIYKMWENGYKYRLLDQVALDGKKYNLIELTPEDKSNQIFKVKLWIDVNNSTMKQWKMFEKSGNRYTYIIKTFKENVPTTSSTFKFDKAQHKGVIITDLRD